MDPEVKPIRHRLLDDIEILLHGVPCRSSRGWLGYCSIVLFPLEDGLALFDTGHFSDRFLLLEVLKERALNPSDIKYVFVSHLHFDHILNIPLFRNASLKVAKAEVEYARRVVAGEIDDPSIPENWESILAGHEVELIDGAVRIDDRTELEVLPGHTPGGLVVYRRGQGNVAICGDVIKNAMDAAGGEATAVGLDAASAGSSIRHILEKARVIVPGHDRPFFLHNDVLEFLSPFNWRIRGNLMPGKQDEIMLDVNLPLAVLDLPWSRFSGQ